MKKILVTTDLSGKSKAGVRFAIQLASQAGVTLTFYHGVEIDKPTRWSAYQFGDYVQSRLDLLNNELKAFISSVYEDAGITPGKYEVVVERVRSVRDAIVKYAVAKRMRFICMSTRGAGKLKRLVGTNTSAVVTASSVPVLAIPANYRMTAITEILYASDLIDLSGELAKVKRFASSVKANLTVVHYDYLNQLDEVRTKFDQLARRQKSPGVKFYLEKLNIENSLTSHLRNAVKKFHPSIVVLFTKQDRGWFDRLFLASKSAEATFETKTPLLIYGKGAM